MRSELQALIDTLAEDLRSPAVLEDRDHRTVVYSAHTEPIDDVRRQSILRHQADPAMLTWFRQFGIFRATEPVRIPPHPRRRVLGRLCVPVRHRGRLLGFCWFLDEQNQLGPAELAPLAPALSRLSVLMYDEEMARRLTERDTARLLSPWEELRQAAAQEIAEGGWWPGDTPVLAVVGRPLGAAGRDAHDVVAQALWDLVREAGPSATDELRLTRGDQAILLVRAKSLDDDQPGRPAAARVRRALLHRMPDAGDPARPAEPAGPVHPAGTGEPDDRAARVVVGIGEPVPRLAQAVVSYRQALLAAQVAARVPAAGEVRRWRALGAFRVLTQLPSDEAAAALDPRVVTLFRSGGPDVVRTVETYLDLGGDVKATAEKLYLHRATLYYRLEKAQRLTGLDLRDGDDRLAAHLSLKLSRLTGQHPYTA